MKLVYKEYASKDYILANQPDFLQDDQEQASYIKNKPCYSTYEFWPEVVSPERTIHFNPSDGAWSQINGGPLSFDNPVSLTESYRITVENNVLECDFKIATVNNTIYRYLGNGSLFHYTLDNSGEPFYIEINNSGQISKMIYDQRGGVYNYTKTFKIEYKKPINKPIELLRDVYTASAEDENIGGPASYACTGYKATEGDKLRLTINDKESVEIELLKSPLNENYLYAGNLGLAKAHAPDYELSEESYALLIPVDSALFEIYFDQSGEYNYKLELLPTEIIHKLDNKYLNDDLINLPFSVDADGNIIIEKDLYFDNLNSIRALKSTVDELSTQIGSLTEQLNTANNSLAELVTKKDALEMTTDKINTQVIALEGRVASLEESQATVIADYELASDLLGGITE
jgi:hypothetical protein